MVAVPASISDSHCRPRATAMTSLSRFSARIGRASACDEPTGTIRSRWRRRGVLLHGRVRTDCVVLSSELTSEMAISVRITSIRRTWALMSLVSLSGASGPMCPRTASMIMASILPAGMRATEPAACGRPRDPTFLDVVALSHELSETFNDPFVNNFVP
jgi:hypothetical protein